MKVKAYTDIEQSKKLAEILPFESADMVYGAIHNIGQEIHHCNVPIFAYASHKDIPCWSLAALLDVLPNDCGVNKEEEGKFVASYLISDECGAYAKTNPIDACYEMIIKLNEQNLL